MLDHFLTTDDYTCLLHEATPIIYALVHKAYIYAVQMHIPSSCNNLCSQGCSSLSIKVGSEVNDYRLNQLCMWTYYMHMFSLSLCSFLGLQCALVSRETLTWLTCNCVNFLYQPATPVTTQGLKRSFCFMQCTIFDENFSLQHPCRSFHTCTCIVLKICSHIVGILASFYLYRKNSFPFHFTTYFVQLEHYGCICSACWLLPRRITAAPVRHTIQYIIWALRSTCVHWLPL